MPSTARLGPVAERQFRLLLAGRTISFLGSAFEPVAVAFAVLQIASPSALGLVLAANSIPTIALLLVGGVVADRLPRHAVMVSSNLLSGAAQAVFALLIVSGHTALWSLMAVQAIRGTSAAFFFPAAQGIVPATVSSANLQQANSLLRLSRNASTIAGAAAAGIVVAAFGPAWALAVDSISFFSAAALIARMTIAPLERDSGPAFVRELVEGWTEFRSRRWIWVVVAAFALLNAAQTGAFYVLGPAIARTDLGGPAAWGFVLTAMSTGLVAGNLLGLRLRPRRPLLAACLFVALEIPPLLLLAARTPAVAVAVGAFGMGVGVEVFGIFWDTALQQHVPPAALSRVTSYDALGSWALMPLGYAAVGPSAALLGARSTLLLAAGAVAAAVAVMVATPDVRRLAVAPAEPVRVTQLEHA